MITVVCHVNVKNPEDCPFQYYMGDRSEPICSYTKAVCRGLSPDGPAQVKCPLRGNTQVIVTPEPKGGS